jgi:hypothetical protein
LAEGKEETSCGGCRTEKSRSRICHWGSREKGPLGDGKNDFIKTYHGWSFIGSDESCHNNDNDSGKDDSHGRAHPEIPKLLYRRGAFESLVWFEDRWMVASWCDE